MELNIYGGGFKLTPGLAEHVRDRIGRALGRIAGRIENVTVRLSDINGKRGGADMSCRMVIRAHHMPALMAQATSADLYAAVDEAAIRAREALWRHLKRRRTLRREFANRRWNRAAG